MAVDPRRDQAFDDPEDAGGDAETAAKEAAIGKAFVRSAGVALLLAAAGGVWWWTTRVVPPPVVPVVAPRAGTGARPAPAARPPAATFTDITQAAGVTFVHENGASDEKLLPETMGGGAAFLDYDRDGKPDILLTNGRRWPWDNRPASGPPATTKLYRNRGDGTFEDVSAAVGLDIAMYATGVAVGDFDNDGWPDVYLCGLDPEQALPGGPGKLFRNDRGKFVDVTAAAGVGGAKGDWATSAAFFDVDNDGKLDLFVLRYVDWSRAFDKAQPFTLIGGGRGYGRPQDFPGSHPWLYRNLGDGKFEEISGPAGLRVRNTLGAGSWLAKSLALAPFDFDGDGYVDVVVANDMVQNFLLRNRGGRFEEIGIAAQLAFDERGLARGAMGVDAADFRNDGSVGVAIGNFANEMTALYVSQPPKRMLFVDEANACGIGPQSRTLLKFGVFFFDYDLDGRLDLFEANGHLENEIARVQNGQTYAQPAQLFWNAGPDAKDEFQDVPAERCGADLKIPMVGRAACYADIDGDGDLDVLVAAVGGPARLLRNDQKLGHHWLRLRLEGDGRLCNRDAIGAVVEATTPAGTQRRTVMPCRSYQSSCELPVTFGFGAAAAAPDVAIRWPDGTTQKLPGLALDRLHVVKHPAAPR